MELRFLLKTIIENSDGGAHNCDFLVVRVVRELALKRMRLAGTQWKRSKDFLHMEFFDRWMHVISLDTVPDEFLAALEKKRYVELDMDTQLPGQEIQDIEYTTMRVYPGGICWVFSPRGTETRIVSEELPWKVFDTSRVRVD